MVTYEVEFRPRAIKDLDGLPREATEFDTERMSMSAERRSQLKLHPEFLKKNGRNEFVVLPYEEFIELQEMLADVEDLLELRKAKSEDNEAPGLTLDEVRRRLGLDAA